MTGKKLNRRMTGEIFLAVLAVILGCIVVYGFLLQSRTGIGPEQPIPFSHRVHAGKKKISCFLCHPDVLHTARAGVPPLRTCMLCHSRVIITFPPIRVLREHYFEGKPVLWKRVYQLPDFVYFNHSVHLLRSVDCSHCHGDVPHMDRIVRIEEHLQMGFCIDCHRKHNVTHDCFTCHR